MGQGKEGIRTVNFVDSERAKKRCAAVSAPDMAEGDMPCPVTESTVVCKAVTKSRSGTDCRKSRRLLMRRGSEVQCLS